MKSNTCIAAIALFAGLVSATELTAQEHRYKLVVIETSGGPQGYGDPGHGAANINNQGTAVGVADTSTPDPFFPNFNPLFSSNIGMYPLVYHAFTTRGGALVDLGGLPFDGLPGGGDSNASFITENGLVSGQALNGSIDPLTGWPAESPVLWKDGQIINLGSLGGYEGGTSQANSRGQVAGVTTNAVPDPFSIVYAVFNGFSNGTQTRAFLWDEKRGMQDLGTLGGPDAVAAFINEGGQVAGASYTTSTANAGEFPTQDPFLWENGKMIDLGTLGGTSGFSGGLNNRGDICGISNTLGDQTAHVFLWTPPGPIRDLGTLGGPNAYEVGGMNDAGEFVGFADTPTSVHGFLWNGSEMIDVGTLAGDCFSGAFGINARTQVVGQSISCDFTVFRAFLWQNGHIIDLNVFVPPGSDLTLTDVEKINDRGEMFGEGMLSNGDSRAFLLIPVGNDDPDGITATAENLAALASKSRQTSAIGVTTQREMLSAWRAKHSGRFRIPKLQ